jgi:hypothetical protein
MLAPYQEKILYLLRKHSIGRYVTPTVATQIARQTGCTRKYVVRIANRHGYIIVREHLTCEACGKRMKQRKENGLCWDCFSGRQRAAVIRAEKKTKIPPPAKPSPSVVTEDWQLIEEAMRESMRYLARDRWATGAGVIARQRWERSEMMLKGFEQGIFRASKKVYGFRKHQGQQDDSGDAG